MIGGVGLVLLIGAAALVIGLGIGILLSKPLGRWASRDSSDSSDRSDEGPE